MPIMCEYCIVKKINNTTSVVYCTDEKCGNYLNSYDLIGEPERRNEIIEKHLSYFKEN
jgi:hypothetical protein